MKKTNLLWLLVLTAVLLFVLARTTKNVAGFLLQQAPPNVASELKKADASPQKPEWEEIKEEYSFLQITDEAKRPPFRNPNLTKADEKKVGARLKAFRQENEKLFQIARNRFGAEAQQAMITACVRFEKILEEEARRASTPHDYWQAEAAVKEQRAQRASQIFELARKGPAALAAASRWRQFKERVAQWLFPKPGLTRQAYEVKTPTEP